MVIVSGYWLDNTRWLKMQNSQRELQFIGDLPDSLDRVQFAISQNALELSAASLGRVFALYRSLR